MTSSSRQLVTLLAALCFGCGGAERLVATDHPPSPPASFDEERPTPAAAPSSYRLAWELDAGNPSAWASAVAIQPAAAGEPHGDVLSVVGHELQLHARDSGEVLTSRNVCLNRPASLRFIDATRAVLFCEGAISEITMPALDRRTITEVARVEDGTYAAGRIAVGGLNGVQVFDLQTGAPIDSFIIEHAFVETVRLSPDGKRLAVGTAEGKLVLRDVDAKHSVELFRNEGGETSRVLGFSPDGRSFIVNDRPNAATVYPNAGIAGTSVDAERKGVALMSYPTGNEAFEVAVFASGDFAIAGDAGLRIISDSAVPLLLRAAPAVSVAASEDADMVCSGDRRGVVSCYTKSEIPKSTLTRAQLDAMTTMPVHGGEVVSRSGSRLVLNLDGAPPSGKRGTLRIRVRIPGGGVDWYFGAEVLVVSGRGDAVVVHILHERDEISMNGSAADYLVPGRGVELQQHRD